MQFNKEDFKHLTGIQSDLNPKSFFNNCLNETITRQNIKTNQTKDWNSIRGKLKIIENIDDMIYGAVEDVLLINILYTRTREFPLALRNDSRDMAVAFVDKNLHARSLRKARHSLQVKNTYEIIQIRVRNKDALQYKQIIYLGRKI